jgi:cytoskeletal protein CcmA (bactofilin family)
MVDQNLQSFLDRGTAFEGKISFSGTVRIDGRFKGQAHAPGTLVIGEGAVVEADVTVGSVVIHGKVVGQITAADTIQIGAQGRVEGSLRARRLQVAEGAQINAKIEMERPSGTAPSREG